MEYYIRGDTYPIKEDLKAWGCHWVPDLKAWETPYLEKEEIAYKRLKGLTESCNAFMDPVILNKECQKIQDILNK